MRLSPLVVALALAASVASTSFGQSTEASAKLVGETPDATIEMMKRRATAKGATEADQIAALSVIASMSDHATEGVAEQSFTSIASATSGEVKGAATVFARAHANDEGTAAGVAKAQAAGIVTDLAIVGPFRDTGGGLDAHDGPEAPKTAAGFADQKAQYSWGSVEVVWRPVPPTFAQARGVPLDMFIHPRKESCSFVATKIKLDAAKRIVVSLAASGQARLVFDGVDVAKRPARISKRITASWFLM